MYLRWGERHRFKTDVVDSQPRASRRGSRARPSPSTGGSPTAGCAPSAASTASCGSAPTTRRSGARRPSPWSRSCPRPTRTSRSSSTGTRSGSTRSARRAPAASTSRRPSRRSASPTCRPGSSSTCQNERSATQNRELAIRVLKSRLLELELEKREEELRKLRGEHVTAGWGNQIRSYVLHPYQMVKDLRSGYETSNTGAVLDGDLDAFMQAELERVATGRPPSRRRRRRRRTT